MTVTLIPSWGQDEHITVIKALVTRLEETDVCLTCWGGVGGWYPDNNLKFSHHQ